MKGEEEVIIDIKDNIYLKEIAKILNNVKG